VPLMGVELFKKKSSNYLHFDIIEKTIF